MTGRKRQQKRGTSGPKPASPEARALGTYAERYAAGKALREACPRSAHAIWKAPAGRPDAVELVLRGGEGAGARPAPPPPRPHGSLRVHVLPRGGPHDGLRPGIDAVHRGPRPVLRGRPPVQLRRLCHARKGVSSLPSTISTRPFRRRGSGTSSASRRASWWPAAITA